MKELTGLRWGQAVSGETSPHLSFQAILNNARRMRGGYVEGSGGKRESSAPYPVPRMGSSAANNQPDGSPLSGFPGQRVPTTGPMSSIPLDGLEFMGRSGPPGASSRPGPAGAQVLSMPGNFQQRAPPMQEVKMAGIRPSLPTTRPSSANSVAGQVCNLWCMNIKIYIGGTTINTENKLVNLNIFIVDVQTAWFLFPRYLH